MAAGATASAQPPPGPPTLGSCFRSLFSAPPSLWPRPKASPLSPPLPSDLPLPQRLWAAFPFPGLARWALVGKNRPAYAGDVRDEGSIPGSGRASGGGRGNPLQYACLENHMDRGTWMAPYSPWDRKESDTTEHALINSSSQTGVTPESTPSSPTGHTGPYKSAYHTLQMLLNQKSAFLQTPSDQNFFPDCLCFLLQMIPFLVFEKLLHCCPVAVPIPVHTNSVEGFPFLHILTNICYLCCFWWWPFWQVWAGVSSCFWFALLW